MNALYPDSSAPYIKYSHRQNLSAKEASGYSWRAENPLTSTAGVNYSYVGDGSTNRFVPDFQRKAVGVGVNRPPSAPLGGRVLLVFP